jgi:predicted nucleic acid-binding protein
MYAAGAASPQKADCLAFMRRVAEGKIAGATSAEVLQEILHRYLHSKRPDLARQVFDGFRGATPTIHAVEPDDMDEARRLMDSYPHAEARDLVHLAVMIRRGIKIIVSYDGDFDAFAEIRRITADEEP